ncbi:MAG: isochorismate synthase [Planctomycetota bacterium]
MQGFVAIGSDWGVMKERAMDIQINHDFLSPAVDNLAERLGAIGPSHSFPLAIDVPALKISGWDLLQTNSELTRIVWCERDQALKTFGLGEAASIEATPKSDPQQTIAECRQLLSGHPTLKCFGGLSFNGEDGWGTFGAGRFVVPRLSLSEGTLTLAVMTADDVENARDELRQLKASEPLRDRMPVPVGKSFQPTYDGWQSRVDEALSLIRAEALEKIVLARRTILQFDEPVDPIALAARLEEMIYDCFVFCFDFGTDIAFLGATPERLFRRHGDQLYSEVVAGTRMRGESAMEDERLAIELLTSDKDQREHDIVRKSIRQKLHKFVEHLEVDSQASILRLANKQHLRSSVRGTLKSGVSDGMLLGRLHPTPAVGGYPTDNALPEIARIEPFDRGWYAAPVGWVGADEAQFAVAIRSGLVDGNTLSLYSGAGIVRGSDPDEEWREVENKIQDFMSVLGR